MPPTLANLFTDMAVYLGVVLLLAATGAPPVWWYIQKHGRLNEKDKTILIVGTALLAGVITFPILLHLKGNKKDPMAQQLANIAASMEAQKQRQKEERATRPAGRPPAGRAVGRAQRDVIRRTSP